MTLTLRWKHAIITLTILFSISLSNGFISFIKQQNCSLAGVPNHSHSQTSLRYKLSVGSEHSEAYTWKSISLNGMGFVTGLVVHLKEPYLVYARTDVGGVFRWDESLSQWTALMDQFDRSQRHYYSVESIALDPSDAHAIYAAVGSYINQPDGEILKSTDRGETWNPTNLRTPEGNPVRMGGNEEWRWAGERLAVDPNNNQIIYFGSRLDGLYRSFDGTTTWERVSGFSDLGNGLGGITFVVFDRNSVGINDRSQQSSQTIYVGLMGSGVYRSQDGGNTWQRFSPDTAAFRNPQQAVLASDETLYITFFAFNSPGGVWQYKQEQWTEITPAPNKSYSAITSDPTNSNILMVAEYPLSPQGIYRSIDAGKTWHTVRLRVNTPSWWPNWHLYTLVGALAIDPHTPRRVWLTNGFGVMRTDNITTDPSRWTTVMCNLEELVTLVVKSPPLPNGAALLSGVADMDGFRHESLTEIPSQTHDKGKFGDTTSIDFSEADPNIVVRVGSYPGHGGREDSQGRSAYSGDNGRTWKPFKHSPAGAVNGKVAVSATLQPNGYPIIVWAPQGDVYPHRSLDGGKTWLPTQGAPNRTTLQVWFANQAIASDRVNGNIFYLYKYGEPTGGSFYRSTDGGANWEPTVTGLPGHWLHSVKAAPEMPGEVWLSLHDHALYRSSDAGSSFTPIAQIEKAYEFTFGKAASGYSKPTVFVYGIINGTEGLFRSDNATSLPGDAIGATWIQISNDRQALGKITYLEGDRLTFGKVYVGTGGRGILYGQSAIVPRSDYLPGYS